MRVLALEGRLDVSSSYLQVRACDVDKKAKMVLVCHRMPKEGLACHMMSWKGAYDVWEGGLGCMGRDPGMSGGGPSMSGKGAWDVWEGSLVCLGGSLGCLKGSLGYLDAYSSYLQARTQPLSGIRGFRCLGYPRVT